MRRKLDEQRLQQFGKSAERRDPEQRIFSGVTMPHLLLIVLFLQVHRTMEDSRELLFGGGLHHQTCVLPVVKPDTGKVNAQEDSPKSLK